MYDFLSGWGGGGVEQVIEEERSYSQKKWIHQEIQEEIFTTTNTNFSPTDTKYSPALWTSQGCKMKGTVGGRGGEGTAGGSWEFAQSVSAFQVPGVK